MKIPYAIKKKLPKEMLKLMEVRDEVQQMAFALTRIKAVTEQYESMNKKLIDAQNQIIELLRDMNIKVNSWHWDD